jgi:hypothetical protein
MTNAKTTAETVREVLGSKIHRFVRIVDGLISPNDTRKADYRAMLLDMHFNELLAQVEFAVECDFLTYEEQEQIREPADKMFGRAHAILGHGLHVHQSCVDAYATACRNIKVRAEILRNERYAPNATIA